MSLKKLETVTCETLKIKTQKLTQIVPNFDPILTPVKLRKIAYLELNVVGLEGLDEITHLLVDRTRYAYPNLFQILTLHPDLIPILSPQSNCVPRAEHYWSGGTG